MNTSTPGYYYQRYHFVLGQHGRFTACGREPVRRQSLRRDSVDLIAFVAVTCGVCRKWIRANEGRRVG